MPVQVQKKKNRSDNGKSFSCGGRLKVIFERSVNPTLHEDLVSEAVSMVNKVDSDFLDTFYELIQYPLSIYDRCDDVDHCLGFVAKVCCQLCDENVAQRRTSASGQENGFESDFEEDEDELHPFVMKLFEFLIKVSDSQDKAVRFRSCQFIGILLRNLNVNISDALFAKLINALRLRIRDKVYRIRVIAIWALHRLQSPREPDCSAIEALLFSMQHDPNAEVRQEACKTIAANRQTLPKLIDRCRDINDHVRLVAYESVSKKVKLTALDAKQRVRLLTYGLKDRSEQVREFVAEKFLQSWLQACDGSIVELLYRLHVMMHTECAESTLKALFQAKSPQQLVNQVEFLDERYIIADLKNRGCEKAFFWRYLVQFIQNEADLNIDQVEEIMDRLLPSLLPLADFVFTFVRNPPIDEIDAVLLEHEFISRQLLSLLKFADKSDIAGRDHLATLLLTYMRSGNSNVEFFETMLELFFSLHKDLVQPIQSLMEVVGDLRLSVTSDDPDDENSQEILCPANAVVIDHEDEDGGNRGIAGALKEPADVLMKCLTILCAIMKQKRVNQLNATLRTQHDELILPAVRHVDPGVRNVAFRALGLCCLLDRSLIGRHLVLFSQAVRVDELPIKKTSLEVIFDLLLVNGTQIAEDALPTEVERRNAADGFLNMMVQLLDSDEDEPLRALVAEGLAKLLLHQRIYAPRLLSRLILMWFNPVNKTDSALCRCLGVFFEVFAFSSKNNQDVLEEAFLYAVSTVYDAPKTNPLCKVDAFNVGCFIVELMRRSNLRQDAGIATEDSCAHANLAIRICREIIAIEQNDDNEDQQYVRMLTKILLQLDFEGADLEALRQIHQLVHRCEQLITDRQALKNIQRIGDSIELGIGAENLTLDGNESVLDDETIIAQPDRDVTEIRSRMSDSMLIGANGDSRATKRRLMTADETILGTPIAVSKRSSIANTIRALSQRNRRVRSVADNASDS